MKISDSAFEQLISICQKVYNKAIELIPYSANHPNLKHWEPHRKLALMLVRTKNSLSHRYKELFKRINLFIGDDKAPEGFDEKKLIGTFDGMTNPTMRELYKRLRMFKDKNKYWHKDGTLYEEQHDIESDIKNAIQMGIGNCGELSLLTYALLLECESKTLKDQNIRVERMACAKGDHAFVVVNRKAKSKVHKLSTWGSGAIIIDSWGEDIVYAKTGESLLYDDEEYHDTYKYIKRKSPYLRNSGQIGQGLSERFIENSKKKNRPERFFDWPPKYTRDKITDRERELDHIPMDLQDEPSADNKRKAEEIDEADPPNKKMRMTEGEDPEQMMTI